MERWRRLYQPDRALVAADGDALVGTAADVPFGLTVPGGEVSAAGVTLVGVLPTHRRRGILRQMMERQLREVRERGDPVAVLYASEGLIYPRFGYGLVSFDGEIEIERDRAAFRDPAEPVGQARFVSLDDAARLLPPIYDRVRRVTAGMLSRTPEWWADHRLRDDPDMRHGAGPKLCALWEGEGEAAYALYRVRGDWRGFTPSSTLEVSEAVATSALAHREMWRFLFGIDLIKTVKASFLPIDHPLLLMLAEPRRLHFTLYDGLWLRLVDLPAALAARCYGAHDTLVVDVVDTFCEWDAGAWRLEVTDSRGQAVRTTQAPDIRLPSERLASAYLGGISFARMARAGWIQELTPAAIARADALFRTDQAPWCAEIF